MKPLTPDFRPTRVIVDREGLGVDPTRALRVYGVEPDIIFVREDGWTLGAPKRYELVAFNMWQDYWSHFARKPFRRGWQPISKYAYGEVG